MIKNISRILYIFLKFIDNLLLKIIKKSFLHWFKEFMHDDSYKSIEVLNKKISFFIPNQITEWRVNTFFTKEPETLEWINSFDNTKKFILWDIGANIGLYSIYAAIKHSNSEVISFEPSTSNLRVLSRNISINKLEEKIKIFPNPLTNKANKFAMMREAHFKEGGALNSFGEDFNFEGKEFKSNMNYQLFGTTIDHIIEKNFLDFPNYIKIDVDGLEHLILDGAANCLNNINLKSLSIEINENFKEQSDQILKIMHDNGFKILHKKNNYELSKSKKTKFSETFNYIFIR